MKRTKTVSAALAEPLREILSGKAIPWAEEGLSRFVLAAPTLRELKTSPASLPERISVSARQTPGRRRHVPKRMQRLGNTMGEAIWPEEGLISRRVPTLACVIEGRSDFPVGDYWLDIPAGHSIIIPSGVPQPDGTKPHTNHGGNCDILWLMPWDNVLRCWVCHSRGDKHFMPAPAEACFIQDRQAISFLQTLAAEAAGREPGYEKICQSLLVALWTTLHRRLLQGHFFQAERHGVQTRHDRILPGDPISQVQEYIRNHLHESLTIDKMALATYLSRVQFTRRFRRQTGQTFVEFLTDCRLAEAKRLLLETDWPIITVSEMVGISPTRLRLLFLERIGVTPSQFRQGGLQTGASNGE